LVLFAPERWCPPSVIPPLPVPFSYRWSSPHPLLVGQMRVSWFFESSLDPTVVLIMAQLSELVYGCPLQGTFFFPVNRRLLPLDLFGSLDFSRKRTELQPNCLPSPSLEGPKARRFCLNVFYIMRLSHLIAPSRYLGHRLIFISPLAPAHPRRQSYCPLNCLVQLAVLFSLRCAFSTCLAFFF